MTTIITIIASLCLIIIAVRIKINNSKKSKKDAENINDEVKQAIINAYIKGSNEG